MVALEKALLVSLVCAGCDSFELSSTTSTHKHRTTNKPEGNVQRKKLSVSNFKNTLAISDSI